MKQFWTVLGAVLVVSLSNAQETGNERLLAAYTPTELSAMSEDEVNERAYWSTHGWQFIVDAKLTEDMLDITELTPKGSAPVLTAENFSAETFNPLLYNVVLSEDKPTYYRVGNQGVLFFFSSSRFSVLNSRNNTNQAAAAKRQAK